MAVKTGAKNSASTKATFRFTFFMPRPLQMDTANASIDSPAAMSSSSTIPMNLSVQLLLRAESKKETPAQHPMMPYVSLVH